jgi:hypothetical protein
MPDDTDKKVKDLLDDATRADLERWFGLPSFEQLAEQRQSAASSEDAGRDAPDLDEYHRRIAEALAAVDPALLDAVFRRTGPTEEFLRARQVIEFRIDPSITMVDQAMLDRQRSIAEPRTVEISPQLIEDLQEATPQALLRDLHRPEFEFDNRRELYDPIAEARVDIAAMVAEAMTPRRLEKHSSTFREGYELVQALREERRRPWAEIEIPHRRGSR